MTLKFAIPNKGRLSERTVQILNHAGLEIEGADERKLYTNVQEPFGDVPARLRHRAFCA